MDGNKTWFHMTAEGIPKLNLNFGNFDAFW
jgi:hypothetical protein